MRFPQRSFDDLGTPLSEVTFCVFDLETTGGDPETCRITEIGAVKVRGGQVLGTFGTLVNPGCAIPPRITVLTGITDQLVLRAPGIDEVLPSFLEFLGGAVVVAHNVRFDWGFLTAAVRRHGGPMLGNQRLDTLALSRRLLDGEVRSHRLGDLARSLRLPTRPTHRALDDAMATTELLHALIERASSWGVTGLDDLADLPKMAAHPQWRKLSLTAELPRSPGVYQFVDRTGRTLYVGKAANLRSRVRSYFSSDRRRKVSQLLRETANVTHQVCASTLEAEVVELRLIHDLQPRFNRRNRAPIRPCWIRLTDERFPRLSIVGTPDGGLADLGPFTNRRDARAVVDAIHSGSRLRRCTKRIGKTHEPSGPPCSAAQLGVACCPCSGETSDADYAPVVADVRRIFDGDPSALLVRLSDAMTRLATAERFEEAATMRHRAEAVTRVMERRRRLSLVAGVDRLLVEDRRGTRIRLGPGGVLPDLSPTVASSIAPLDEALCVASWLQRHADELRVLESVGVLASPLPALPDFSPRTS